MEAAHEETLRVKLAGLELQIRGRQSLGAPTYDDDDWLSMSARCHASGADVVVPGLIVSIPTLECWCDQIAQMQLTLSGNALLNDLEQQLTIELLSRDFGHIRLKVEITPDHLTQSHSFLFEIDQSYLGPVLTQLRAVLREYPIHGRRPVAR